MQLVDSVEDQVLQICVVRGVCVLPTCRLRARWQVHECLYHLIDHALSFGGNSDQTEIV